MIKKLRFGFRSKTQSPLFMLWVEEYLCKEDYIAKEPNYAYVVFQFGLKEK